MACMKGVCQAGTRGGWEIPAHLLYSKEAQPCKNGQKGQGYFIAVVVVVVVLCFVFLNVLSPAFQMLTAIFSGNIACGL